MKVIFAETAGYCFGVARAVEMCESICETAGGCVTLGPLIHNAEVIEQLRGLGAIPVSDISEIPDNATVLIRAHGIGRAQYDALSDKKAEIIDATCPYVEKIHELVRGAQENGRLPIIIGEKAHPEIIGIAGWCEQCRVFETPDELRLWLKVTPKAGNTPLTVVFQTTETREIYDSVAEIVKKECTNCEIFDTICDATNRRQSEARRLAKKSDAFIVIGDRDSANSRRLAEIAREECSRVYFIENADELDLQWFEPGDTVGVTAGASTPARIIKEVNQKMLDETQLKNEIEVTPAETAPAAEAELAADIPIVEEAQAAKAEVVEAAIVEAEAFEAEAVEAQAPDEEERTLTFEEMLELSIKTLHTGERVTGVVAAITPTEITVDLGIKQSGYIPVHELTDDPSVKIEDIVKIGEDIEAIVMRVNDVEGMVMLSRRRLDAIRNWSDIEEAMEKKTVVEGTVTEENKGGVVVMVRGIRVFVPASRTGLPRSAPMTELVKQKVKLVITEVNQPRRRVVGSIAAVANDERRLKSEQVWAEIEDGKRYKGVVKSLTSYGAFVDIGGVDGMVHVSELSWTHIAKPADVLSVGDEIEVYVISFDREKKKISLGYKDHSQNPWVKFTDMCKVGDIVTVKIVKLMKFGAFAEILPGVDGLIHVSQIANYRIGEPGEVLAEGDIVDAKLVEIDNEKQKVSLSIRALLEDANRGSASAQDSYGDDDGDEPEDAQ